jgi:hypothetical protein
MTRVILICSGIGIALAVAVVLLTRGCRSGLFKRLCGQPSSRCAAASPPGRTRPSWAARLSPAPDPAAPMVRSGLPLGGRCLARSWELNTVRHFDAETFRRHLPITMGNEGT